ncbi:hypothetical protein BH10PSE9_BH10PSE9_14870 [soil metagenome]
MPTIKRPFPLFTSEDCAEATEVQTRLGEEVEIITPAKDATNVLLVGRLGKPHGWTPTEMVDFTKSAPLPTITLPDFAGECWAQALYFGINAHFLAAIGMLRSELDNQPKTGAVGPYRLTEEQFAAFASDEGFEIKFASRNVTNWRIQCVVFALMATRALKRQRDALHGQQPTAIGLYLDWLALAGLPVPVGDELVALTTKLGKALDDTRDAVKKAGEELIDATTDTGLLGNGATTIPAAAGAQIAGIDLSSVKLARRPTATLIAQRFKDAGYGLIQQITAIANAIHESGLDPAIKAAGNEDSWGLFQLNRRGGLGRGHTSDELKNAENNIRIIVAETKKFPAFAAAASLADAVSIFVRKIERPANQPHEISARLKTAQKLAQ